MAEDKVEVPLIRSIFWDKDDDCAICLDKIQNKTKFICGHYFCKECVFKQDIHHNNELIVKFCPLCRREINLQTTYLSGILELEICAYICGTCKCDIEISFSKCLKSNYGGEKIPIEKILPYNVLIFRKITGLGILFEFTKDRPMCGCCYLEFGKRLFLYDTTLFHIFSNSYIKTDLPCLFLKDSSLKECDHHLLLYKYSFL